MLSASILFGTFMILVTMLVILLPLSLLFHTERGKMYRKEVAQLLEKIRLGGILSSLGIDNRRHL